MDPEFMEDLSKSMDDIGQLDDVIVRRNEEGDYELISGSQRLTAAKNLNWEEIDAKVIDVSEQEAAILALESNIMRRGLKEIEEGKAIQKMMDKYELTQNQIAERLRRSQSWVSRRLSLALEVIKEVQNAIMQGEISVEQAVIIGQLPKNRQAEFLNLIIQKQKELDKKLTGEETRLELRRFQNDTIITIGYQGWEFKDFVEALKKNKIEVLVDIRQSGTSMYKPEFSEKILNERITEAGIKYFDRSELGVPFDFRDAYMRGGLSDTCFEQWYTWYVSERDGNKVTKLAEEVKDVGRPALMCTERYPTARGEQKNNCHRDILARLILKSEIFTKRTDL